MKKLAGPALIVLGGLALAVAVLLKVRVPVAWWNAIVSQWPTLLMSAGGLVVAAAGVVLRRRSVVRDEPSAAPLAPNRVVRPLPSWMLLAGLAVAAGVTWGAVQWLQHGVPTGGGNQVERSQLIDSIRTGLTIGAGVTGAFALLLAFRRQQLAERTQQATEYDAGEKRVTELYVKAVDQLGSAKAPVRLGGLYALERLARDCKNNGGSADQGRDAR